MFVGEPEDAVARARARSTRSIGSATIPSLTWRTRRRDRPAHARRARSPGFPTMPYPAWDLRRRSATTRCRWSTSRTCIVETSRGCPYSCDFCVAPIHQGHKFRERSAKALVDEIERSYREFGVDFFYLWGDTVTLNVKTFTRVLRRADRAQPADPVVRQRPRRQPHRSGVRRTACARPAAGCWRWASRPSPRKSARTWSRGSSAQKIQTALNNMRDAGIRSFAFFIFGYPGETPATIDQTIEYAIELESRLRQLLSGRAVSRHRALRQGRQRDGLLVEEDWSRMEYSYYLLRGQRPGRARGDGRDQPRQAALLPAPGLSLGQARRRDEARGDQAGDLPPDRHAHDLRRHGSPRCRRGVRTPADSPASKSRGAIRCAGLRQAPAAAVGVADRAAAAGSRSPPSGSSCSPPPSAPVNT